MTRTSDGKRQSAFSQWLPTGRRPSTRASDGVEVKFNPWHDPADGRFTFAGSGRYQGTSGRSVRQTPPRLRIATTPKAKAPPAEQLNPVTEFIGGVGEGLYGVAKETVASARSALTTNPVTTIRNAERGIAGMIDRAIVAEDTPASIQVARAAEAVANASARDIGRATGSVVGNGALAIAPGATFNKVTTLRSLREVTPRPIYNPPEIGWVKENLGKDSAAKRYNDAATGARPGQAPTLTRTMPDGSKRPVKFDGFEGEYVIDRKWRVVNAPRARNQLVRQSEVLAQNRLVGVWEVPDEKQRVAATKLFRIMKIANIKVRVVKP